MIEVDGSVGEGGGAVLRTALALSAVSQHPIHIFNVRAKRKKPGLQPQHLRGVEALAKLTNARVEGMELNSTELVFEPGAIEGGRYHVDIGTAGSTTLILQILMPAATFARKPIEVEITGGTDNPMAIPIDFLKNVTMPTLQKMGYQGEVECVRRGHYPRGGGIVRARIEPVEKLRALKLTKPGRVICVAGVAHCVRLPAHIATRMAHAASMALVKAGHTKVNIKAESYSPTQDPHLGPGTGITLWAETEGGAILGASSLGERGKPAERVGGEAAESLLTQLQTGCAVDRHLTDQLVPYLALAEGTSEITSVELTSHALTNIALLEQIMGVKFDVKGDLGHPGRIRVQGTGFSRK
ncbi:MAG: RNA 3'-terminal phosphate cyclase [Hadesarchaea archaeon]|nr:RNA 3'-terminal phosphate cyclase [Hadesarchaea archaeon]